MPHCLVALGGNLGPVVTTFRAAIDRLDQFSGVAVQRVSSIYRTRAVGNDAGTDYLNAALLLDTESAPLELLDRLFGKSRVDPPDGLGAGVHSVGHHDQLISTWSFTPTRSSLTRVWQYRIQPAGIGNSC